ncbi:MAG: SGNH/GDSL hydrolase family protein [Solirubrobacterales bacterium]
MTASRLLALACLLGLLLTPVANAREPVPVEVGQVGLALPVDGRGALLIPVRYPIQLVGQRLELRVSLRRPRRGTIDSWISRTHANGGPLRLPERRGWFRFVHRIDLSRRTTRRIRHGLMPRPTAVVNASAALDLNRDGKADLAAGDTERQHLPSGYARRLCATVPQLRIRRGRPATARLPACGANLRWRVSRAAHGAATIRDGRLIYRPEATFRGTESLELRGRVAGAKASARQGKQVAPVQVKVLSGAEVSVRALGDSVTAGFGYYDDGTQMQFTSLLSCKPGAKAYDDACSSNSLDRSNEASQVEYAPDYGLSNNVSWAAQWANQHGVTNFANFAVSGSEPKDWSPGGQLYDTTKRVEAENPDYVLLTAGANPLLSEMLFGVDNMGCAIWADVAGEYRECIEEAFAGVKLRANLKALYTELVDNTDATIYLMQYPLSVPASALAYSATQIAMMGAMLNGEIAAVAAEVDGARLQVIAPPHFNVGIDVSPVFPSEYTCSSLGYLVDGRSVQSDASQDELLLAHPLSFCPGPAKGEPWVIGGDTGIHPSATGYAQMASQLPAPE